MEKWELSDIAYQIRQGYTSGYHPYWNLNADYEVLQNEEDMDYIASLVKQGFTSGYYPTWAIVFE